MSQHIEFPYVHYFWEYTWHELIILLFILFYMQLEEKMWEINKWMNIFGHWATWRGEGQLISTESTVWTFSCKMSRHRDVRNLDYDEGTQPNPRINLTHLIHWFKVCGLVKNGVLWRVVILCTWPLTEYERFVYIPLPAGVKALSAGICADERVGMAG